MRIEIHSHSSYSDGINTVEEMLKFSENRVDAIAITDHNTFKGYEAAKKKKKNVFLIPGIEVSTNNGHVLCIGLEELRFKKNCDALELIDAVHESGGITINAHPCRIFQTVKNEQVFHRSDAIEIINGNTPAFFNKKALAVADTLRKAKITGSDAHRVKDIGSFAFNVNAQNIDEIIKCIRKGKTVLDDKQPTLASLVEKKTQRITTRFYRKIFRKTS